MGKTELFNVENQIITHDCGLCGRKQKLEFKDGQAIVEYTNNGCSLCLDWQLNQLALAYKRSLQ